VSSQDFVADLNDQINAINKVRKAVNERGRSGNYYHDSPEDSKTNLDLSSSPMELTKESDFSYPTSRKLMQMQELPTLSQGDLKGIIKSGINKDTVTGEKVNHFLHALCGFWFSRFMTSKYANTELLLDSFRERVKKTFYYKTKGIVSLPTPTPPPDNSKLSEEQQILQNLKTELDKLKKDYIEDLKENNIKGTIDDLHKWVNNESGYGFDSELERSLREKMSELINNSVLKNEKPSWEQKQSILSGTSESNEENEANEKNEDKTFQAEDYLNEALAYWDRPHNINRLIKPKDHHPFRKCFMNPSHFFNFEKKVVVGKINSQSRYGDVNHQEGGEMLSLNISEDFLMNTQRDQGSNQDFSSDLGTGLTLLALPLLAISGIVATTSIATSGLFRSFSRSFFMKNQVGTGLTLLAFTGLLGNIKYNYKSYEGTGKRKLLSIRLSKGVELRAEHTPITLTLDNYHECLVIKPRFSAFESHTDKYKHIWEDVNPVILSMYKEMGMFLCTPGENKNITENYYYIYPNYPVNSITMDTSDHKNKPFVISLRGKKEYKKFTHDLSCYVAQTTIEATEGVPCRETRGKYEYLLSKNLEFASDLRQGFEVPKLFHLTGDTPGIHSVYVEEEDRDIRTNAGMFARFMNWFSEQSLFDQEIEAFVNNESSED